MRAAIGGNEFFFENKDGRIVLEKAKPHDEILENRILERVAGKKESEAEGENVVGEEARKNETHHKEVV